MRHAGAPPRNRSRDRREQPSERVQPLRSEPRARTGVLPRVWCATPRFRLARPSGGRGSRLGPSRTRRTRRRIRRCRRLPLRRPMTGATLRSSSPRPEDSRRSPSRRRSRRLQRAPPQALSPGPRRRTVGRSRSRRFRRQRVAGLPSLVRIRPAGEASRRWASSTPRSTRASIPGTGSSSPGSTGPRPRRPASSSALGDSRAPPRCGESSHRRTAVVSTATFGRDFVTSSERRYTLSSGASKPHFSASGVRSRTARGSFWKITSHSYALVCINTRERSTARSRA